MTKEVIGIDPAYINYAICKIRFRGIEYDPVSRIEMPLFTVENLEIWDLAASCIIRHTEVDGGEARLTSVGEPTAKKTVIRDWLNKLEEFITAATWIHTANSETGKLPRVTIENQCGHIKNGDYTMFKIARATQAYIKRCDKKKSRIIGLSARKYGIKSDGKLAYGGRKNTATEVVRSLFTAMGLDNWLRYLDSLVQYGQKIDDVCDAILLALQVAMNEHEEDQKRKAKTGGLDFASIDNTTYPILLSVTNTETGKEEFSRDASPEPTLKRKRVTKSVTKPVKKSKVVPIVTKESIVKRKRVAKGAGPSKKAKMDPLRA